MNILYTSQNSAWKDQPNNEEIKELEYNQLEEGAGGNGKGNGNGNSVPVNGGIVFAIIASCILGVLYNKKWKSSRI